MLGYRTFPKQKINERGNSVCVWLSLWRQWHVTC